MLEAPDVEELRFTWNFINFRNPVTFTCQPKARECLQSDLAELLRGPPILERKLKNMFLSVVR